MIYIVSLQYSPVFKSHCYALGKQLKKDGYKLKYLLSSEYKWMLKPDEYGNILFLGRSKDLKTIFTDSIKISNIRILKKSIKKDQPQYVYFHNIHPFFNGYITKQVKNYGGKVIQHIHEPYVEDKSVYGGIQQYWLYLFEYLQGKLLKNTDKVIISSQESLRLFKIRYPDYDGEIIQIPLFYEDLAAYEKFDLSGRHYINFMGPPIPAKGPETFLNIVKHAKNQDFLLISRLKVRDQDYYRFDNLEIFYQEKISDELIGKFMKESLMTITPYKTARQSSVASTAYMYGTPVLGTYINGLKEFVNHQKTGYLVGVDSEIDGWLEGICYIIDNWDRLSLNCRSVFEKVYSENNWSRYIGEVFK